MTESLSPMSFALTLAQAESIIDAALAAGREHGLLPLAVAVLDSGSHLVAFRREDGCANLRYEIARGKAAAALGMGMSTRLIRDRLAQRPAFQAALSTAARGEFIPVPGGVLLLDDVARIIGAVGISGDTSDKDEFCAIAGARGTGLACEPAAPAPAWQDSQL